MAEVTTRFFVSHIYLHQRRVLNPDLYQAKLRRRQGRQSDPNRSKIWNLVSRIKIAVGWALAPMRRDWSLAWDIIVAVSSLTGELVALPRSLSEGDNAMWHFAVVARYISLARVLRVFRAVLLFPRFAVIVATVIRLMRPMQHLVRGGVGCVMPICGLIIGLLRASAFRVPRMQSLM